MSDFSISPQILSRQAGSVGALAGSISSSADKVQRAAEYLRGTQSSMEAVVQLLGRNEESLRDYAAKAEALTRTLENCAGLYIRTEKRVRSQFFVYGQAGPVTETSGGSSSSAPGMIRNTLSETLGIQIQEDIARTIVKKKKSRSSAAVYSNGIAASVYHAFYTADRKWEYGSIHAEVGQSEAQASLVAGLYRRKVNGSTVLRPEIDAVIGAGFSLFAASGQAKFGDQTFGVIARGEAEAGSVEADLTAKAKLFSSEGQIQPEITGRASLEAIALEAGGAITGNVLGLEATARGSVNVGIGGHAEFSIVGTKIKGDVGASLGVGGSFGFELDPKDALAELRGAAQSVLQFLFEEQEA